MLQHKSLICNIRGAGLLMQESGWTTSVLPPPPKRPKEGWGSPWEKVWKLVVGGGTNPTDIHSGDSTSTRSHLVYSISCIFVSTI